MPIQHQLNCTVYDLYHKKVDYDLPKPGAFAQLICHCQNTKTPLFLAANKENSMHVVKVVFCGNHSLIIESDHTLIQIFQNRLLAKQAPDKIIRELLKNIKDVNLIK